MASNPAIQSLYEEALETLVSKLKQDPYVLAAVLLGSLSHDVVWEKSDIDLLIVTQETRQKEEGFCLVERGVNIHAILSTRSEFRKMMVGAIQSSFLHSTLMKGRLLFSHDETVEELFANRHTLGARDREIQLLSAVTFVLPALTKAEKWLHVKQDADYSFLWIMKCVDGLASIETLLQGEITGREVVQQALRHNPAFFRAIYTDLIRQEKTPETIGAALQAIHAYLHARIFVLFKPLLDYLAESDGIRSATEINHYFANQMNLEGVDGACEWLADEEILQKVSSPLRLTEKSRVNVEEAAYYYEGRAEDSAPPCP
jgi:predicted nucleotidyltransferase